jgi:hypothetical protein
MRLPRLFKWPKTTLVYLIFIKKSGRVGIDITLSIREEFLDMAMPWDFFDGFASKHHLICGAGGRGGCCLYLSTTHHFLLKSGLGDETNNYAKLLALKLLLIFAMEKGCKTLQVFGDSMLIINWANGVQDVTFLILCLFMRKF